MLYLSIMAECSVCGLHTELFLRGVPLCFSCAQTIETNHFRRESSKTKIQITLEEAQQAARTETHAARTRFREISREIPSGLPHPDGLDRIRLAGVDVRSAEQKYLTATTRLTEFLIRGIVPDDLE